ncbi:MAG: hypothetical protein IT453_05985 [Planctomycetes bacterium]|nr:hypothetical protein [Planctomycetota bacterium]
MIELEHPRLAWLALAPLALWLFARIVRAPDAPSGTVELWRELEATRPSARRRTLANWRFWCASVALVAAAFALAGPLKRGALARPSWRILVDTTPSMFLAVGGAGGPTRLARALELAEPWLAARAAKLDALVWVRWNGATFEERPGERCPAEWLRAPDSVVLSVPFERCAGAGWVWITDVARDARKVAGDARPGDDARESPDVGLFASGGATVPGAIAESAEGLLEWRGDELVARPRTATGVRVDPACPEPLRELADAWASARGLTVGREPAVLALVAVADGTATPVRAARDGWSLAGSARPLALAADERAWLVDGERVLVAASAGRVRVAFETLEEPGGDPAAFAVAWSELFDDARRPEPGVVPLEERRAAGEPVVREPSAPPERDAPIEARWSFELALVAACFALLLFF